MIKNILWNPWWVLFKLVAITIPIFKNKGDKNIENYRPIANSFSTSKVFEKSILKRM
jgi:hypothetical protein